MSPPCDARLARPTAHTSGANGTTPLAAPGYAYSLKYLAGQENQCQRRYHIDHCRRHVAEPKVLRQIPHKNTVLARGYTLKRGTPLGWPHGKRAVDKDIKGGGMKSKEGGHETQGQWMPYKRDTSERERRTGPQSRAAPDTHTSLVTPHLRTEA